MHFEKRLNQTLCFQGQVQGSPCGAIHGFLHRIVPIVARSAPLV